MTTTEWPQVIRFDEGVRSHSYSYGARVIIDARGWVTKDRGGSPGRPATQEELDACVTITAQMAKAVADERRAFAQSIVSELLARKGLA